MKKNKIALRNVKNTFLDDRLCSNVGLSKLLKCEIVQVLSEYVEIDPSLSTIDIDINQNGVFIDCKIRALNIKRFGLNY